MRKVIELRSKDGKRVGFGGYWYKIAGVEIVRSGDAIYRRTGDHISVDGFKGLIPVFIECDAPYVTCDLTPHMASIDVSI